MSLFSNIVGSMPSCGALLFTSVSAACTLSRMTSPSWPVRIMAPRPGQAGGHAGNAGTLRDLAFEARLSQHVADVLRRDHDLRSRAFGDLHRGMAEQLPDL